MPLLPLDTPFTVILPVALIAPPIETPTEPVAVVEDTLLAVINPELGVQPLPVHPNVLSMLTVPGKGALPVPIAAVVIGPPAERTA